MIYILITDNDEVKYYFTKYNNIILTLDLKICQIGLPNNSIESIRDTLTEFFITTNAKSIETYSSYPWISGFVQRINEIYDIPIKSLG